MFIERPLLAHTESLSTSASTIAIENLREIMSDLMLVASWSKKPAKLKTQQTKTSVEIVAESFITTENRHSKVSLCEITHEIENFPLSHPSILRKFADYDYLNTTIVELSHGKTLEIISKIKLDIEWEENKQRYKAVNIKLFVQYMDDVLLALSKI